MTTADEPTADAVHTGEGVPREQMWERIRNVDRDWSPERRRTASGPSRVLVPFDDDDQDSDVRSRRSRVAPKVVRR